MLQFHMRVMTDPVIMERIRADSELSAMMARLRPHLQHMQQMHEGGQAHQH